LLDLGLGETAEITGTAFRRLEVARAAVEARWLWNVARWKTHPMMGLTLGVKNLFGCVPGKKKIAAHFRSGRDPDGFARQLLDLCEALAPSLTLLDGVVAMEGPGPSRGQPIRRGLLLASESAPALDWEATRLSGFEPAHVPTVRLSLEERGLEASAIRVLGDAADVLRFQPAPGTPCDWPLPAVVRRVVRRVLSPPPNFLRTACTGCGVCAEACPPRALSRAAPPELSQELCIRCYCCHELCPSGAVRIAPRRLRGVLSSAFGRSP
jgi:ferredoxin